MGHLPPPAFSFSLNLGWISRTINAADSHIPKWNLRLPVQDLQWRSFFMVKLSHPYVTTGKILTLTKWTFAGKGKSLLFNMLCRFIIAFLPRNKHLLISWLLSPSSPFSTSIINSWFTRGGVSHRPHLWGTVFFPMVSLNDKLVFFLNQCQKGPMNLSRSKKKNNLWRWKLAFDFGSGHFLLLLFQSYKEGCFVITVSDPGRKLVSLSLFFKQPFKLNSLWAFHFQCCQPHRGHQIETYPASQNNNPKWWEINLFQRLWSCVFSKIKNRRNQAFHTFLPLLDCSLCLESFSSSSPPDELLHPSEAD